MLVRDERWALSVGLGWIGTSGVGYTNLGPTFVLDSGLEFDRMHASSFLLRNADCAFDV